MERTFDINDVAENTFKEELRMLLNRYSLDGYTGTPDFILADSIWRHIKDVQTTAREVVRWHSG